MLTKNYNFFHPQNFYSKQQNIYDKINPMFFLQNLRTNPKSEKKTISFALPIFSLSMNGIDQNLDQYTPLATKQIPRQTIERGRNGRERKRD